MIEVLGRESAKVKSMEMSVPKLAQFIGSFVNFDLVQVLGHCCQRSLAAGLDQGMSN